MTRCLVSGHQIAWRSNAKDLWSPSQNIEGIKFTHWCALISTPQARIQWKVSCNDTSCRSHLLAHFTFPNKTIWIPTWRHTNSMKLIRQARLAKGTNIMGLYGFAKPKNTYQLIYSSSMFQPKPFPKSLRQFLFILGFSSKRVGTRHTSDLHPDWFQPWPFARTFTPHWWICTTMPLTLTQAPCRGKRMAMPWHVVLFFGKVVCIWMFKGIDPFSRYTIYMHILYIYIYMLYIRTVVSIYICIHT